MSEFLIPKESLNDSIYSQSTDSKEDQSTDNTNRRNSLLKYSSNLKINLFDFDLVSDKLKKIHTSSKIRQKLGKFLAFLYNFPILILIFSFIIGFFFFGLPLLFIYTGIITNITIPLIIIDVFTMIFSIILVIGRIIDDLKNKLNFAAKWERQNILKISELFIILIILCVSFGLMCSFFNEIIYYSSNNDLNLIYDEENNYKKTYISTEFVFKYFLNNFLIITDNIKPEKYMDKIGYYISNENDELITVLYKDIMCFCIPFLLIFIFKTIKNILIIVKYTIQKLIIYVSGIFFCILLIISYLYSRNCQNFKNIDENWKTISILEIILISIIFGAYFSWNIHSAIRIILYPKDKNFAISKYDIGNLIIILLFDFINIIGISLIYISIIVSAIRNILNTENYGSLFICFIILKIGFILFTISNSFYYGRYLLSLIFRPIALQYAPAELKKYCIRVNKDSNNKLRSLTLNLNRKKNKWKKNN